jgi:hypothetical protein
MLKPVLERALDVGLWAGGARGWEIKSGSFIDGKELRG